MTVSGATPSLVALSSLPALAGSRPPRGVEEDKGSLPGRLCCGVPSCHFSPYLSLASIGSGVLSQARLR
eukprot:4976210-Alexandrium_andersonii.AAC.1